MSFFREKIQFYAGKLFFWAIIRLVICQECDDLSTVQEHLDFIDFRFKELDYEFGSQKEKIYKLNYELGSQKEELDKTREDLNREKEKTEN